MLHEQTREFITSLSDEQLAQYVAVGTEAYEPQAVEFAQEEFARRRLDTQRFVAVQEQAKAQIAEVKAQDAAIATMPLDRLSRFNAFIFGIFILSPLYVLIWLRLESAGAHRKAREIWRFGIMGFGAETVFLVALAYWGGADDRPFAAAYLPVMVFGLLIFLPPAIITVHESLSRRGRTALNQCLVCGYNLTGNTSGVCPECGTPKGKDMRR